MSVMDKNNQPFDDEGLAHHIDLALSVDRPSGTLFERAYPVLKRIFTPEILNPGDLPDEPCLFVGNHSLFALDGYVLGPTMYEETGRFLRALGDRFLWTPKTEEFLVRQGAVIGHPTVCTALMQHGCDILVYPGGAHEATKTAAQRYTLQWKERYGFVRQAAANGYTILPFAMIGPDQFYEHLMEGEDIPGSPLGALLERLGVINENTRPDMLPPIPRGALGSLLPRPQRCYIKFGEPVRLAGMEGKTLSKQKLAAIRGEVAEEINELIGELLVYREQHRAKDGLLRRLLTL